MTERVPLDKDSVRSDGPMPSVLPEDYGERRVTPGHLTSKSRKWWMLTALANFGLLWVPSVPLVKGVAEFTEPSASIRLSQEQQDVVNAVVHTGNGTDVERVTGVLRDPTLAERLMAAGPSVLTGLMLGVLAYALWRRRIEVKAGPHQRPFTAKDERWLKRALASMYALFMVFVVLRFYGGHALGFGERGSYLGPMEDATLPAVGLAFLTMTFVRVYRSRTDDLQGPEGVHRGGEV
ncbi:hypothetical protein ACFPC0_10640 [Streptomyces andamanensis]|uniref:DUF2975 domain-containing protein n=1 Tax=Streptomyces andamanensis TaxID=1565035 RepID=A0ABV8TCB2_9ACTN